MRSFALSLAVLILSAVGSPDVVFCEDAADRPAATTAAVVRAISFLQENGVDWKESRQCASCHHVPLMTWAMHEAKRHNIPVDEAILKEATDWCLAEDNSAKIVQVPGEATEENPYPNPLSLATAYMALSESNGPNDPARRPMVTKFLKHIVDVQEADGSWRDFQGRPPIFASRETLTLFLINTMTWPGQPPELQDIVASSRQKAIDWANQHRDDPETESAALRLWMLKTVGHSQAEIDAAVQRLLDRQHADGGWSQSAERASDAYATGQVLYVLQVAGLAQQHEAMRQGIDSLLKTQAKDGSWEMISRPMRPPLEFAVSAITQKPVEVGRATQPANAAGARNNGPIKFTATAWATVALCRTLP